MSLAGNQGPLLLLVVNWAPMFLFFLFFKEKRKKKEKARKVVGVHKAWVGSAI